MSECGWSDTNPRHAAVQEMRLEFEPGKNFPPNQPWSEQKFLNDVYLKLDSLVCWQILEAAFDVQQVED